MISPRFNGHFLTQEKGVATRNERYEANFNAEAVKLALSTDQIYADLARDLGVKYNTLHHWIYGAMNERSLYLAVVINLYSRRVVGCGFSELPNAQLVCDALKMALIKMGYLKEILLHSDRGSQYYSGAYQRLIKAYGLVCSISGKGNCYDNPKRKYSTLGYKSPAIFELAAPLKVA